MIGRRCARVALAALVVAASAFGTAEAAATPQALSPWDAQLYSAAFDAVHHGDFASADNELSQVTDKCLVGMVQFEKLLNPKNYKATYEELTGWLSTYGDLPGAQKVWALAKKRKPLGAPDPAPPAALAGARSWASLDAAQTQTDLGLSDPQTLGPKAAREALNAGDFDNALKLGDSNGDRFTAGLAAFRTSSWEDAFHRFQSIALDVSEDPWSRSQGAYWAARTAIAMGAPEKAPDLLKIAAQYPNTFYGQVAERQLGLEPVIRHGSSYAPAAPIPYLPGSSSSLLIKAADKAGADQPTLDTFLASDPRAHRILALAQIGQKVDVAMELRAGLASAHDEADRANWTALGKAVTEQFAKAPDQQVINDQQYPMPELHARGGVTVDKALLYALIRRESAFNPKAVSWAGAYGLMQLMPATAALVEGDERLRHVPQMLFEPSINLRVGQDYLAWLMQQGPIDGDILRAVAAYDGGPGRVYDTLKALPSDADAILLIESIPVPEAREYVKKVMASYWIYRRLLGQDTKSLDAVVAGAHTVNIAIDQPHRAYAANGPMTDKGTR
jgi:soluble lytic murein transglycosylase-like protein